jgi:hypothetical protein
MTENLLFLWTSFADMTDVLSSCCDSLRQSKRLCKQVPPLPASDATSSRELFVPTPDYKRSGAAKGEGGSGGGSAGGFGCGTNGNDDDGDDDDCHRSSSPSSLGGEGFQRVPLSLTGSLIYMPPEL